jgi:hypothetical protein
VIQAAIALEQNKAAAALPIFGPVRPYDYLVDTNGISGLIPAYLRGLASLQLGDGQSAMPNFRSSSIALLVTDENTNSISLSHL